MVKLAQQIAGSDASVLITGESGTGKEVLARYVHARSQRAKKPFISVNCAAIPENLLESELFGHEKGAFTGAVGRRIGKFEEANGGTLLLDEISEMDVRLQAKLLRAIQERVIDRVGGGQPVPVDIRIIATSNRNLTDAVREGKFREDLLFRLNVVNLKIPPLRERPADIVELAQYFVKKYSAANGLPVRPLSAEARRALSVNRWPGNVRELENTMHRAVLLSSGAEIGVDGILTPDGGRLDQARGTGAVAHAAMAAEQVTRDLVGRTVAEVERDLILETLKHCLGNRTHAANILGISIRTLRNKLNEYAADGVPIPPPWRRRAARRGVGARHTAKKQKARRNRRAFRFKRNAAVLARGRLAGCRRAFRFLSRLVSSLDRLGHQLVADGLQPLDQVPAFARQPDAAVGRLDQIFLGLQHDLSVKDLAGICIEITSIQGRFSAWRHAQLARA